MTGVLAGKVALVTGAARGLGRGCALGLAQAGAHLVLVDVGVVSRIETVPEDLASPADLEQVANEVRGCGGQVLSRLVDVRDADALAGAVQAGITAFGSLDIAVPAATIRSSGSAWAMSEPQWRAVLDVNLSGAWRTAKAVAPAMIEQRSGSIVFIGSTLAHRPAMGAAHLTATKHGMYGLARSFALELAPYGVRANTVDAGGPSTDEPLLDRALQPKDIANAVVFLASDAAGCITGTSLLVDGGASLT